MTDFTAEITALESAIASGARTVSYGDKSVSYDTFSEMLQRLQWLKGQQQVATGQPRKARAAFAAFSRGRR